MLLLIPGIIFLRRMAGGCADSAVEWVYKSSGLCWISCLSERVPKPMWWGKAGFSGCQRVYIPNLTYGRVLGAATERRSLLRKLVGPRLRDVLVSLPHGVIDRLVRVPLGNLPVQDFEELPGGISYPIFPGKAWRPSCESWFGREVLPTLKRSVQPVCGGKWTYEQMLFVDTKQRNQVLEFCRQWDKYKAAKVATV